MIQRVARGFGFLIAALLVLTFLDRFVLLELLARRIGLAVLLAVLTSLAAIGAGHLARRLDRDAILNLIVGYPIFGTCCFLTGLLKVNKLTMLPLLLAFAAAGAFSLRVRDRSVDEPVPDRARMSTAPGDILSMIAIGVVLLLGLVAAQAPPSSLDELAYHLAIPQMWVLDGRAIDLPLISHSYFPLGVESADLPLLAILGSLSGGIASHFVHWLVALATVTLVYRRSGSLLVTAAIAATPALALTAGWSLVDWPLLGVCVALTIDDPKGRPAALAAGLLTKYTFIPLGAVALIASRKKEGVVPGVIGGSVFFLRNLILTGNPIAPFFAQSAPHVAHYRALSLGAYIFDGHFLDESLGSSLLVVLFGSGGLLTAGLIVVALGLLVLAPSARLLVPFLATAGISAGPRIAKRPELRVLLSIAIAAQLFLIAWYVDRNQAFSLLAGKQSDEEFLMKSRASQASIAWLNSVLPQDSRLLVVGLNETYWFSHPTRGGGNFDGPRIAAYVDAPTSEALYSRFKNDRITHVAVISLPPPTIVPSKIEERQTDLPPSAQRSLAQMLDRYASSVTAHANVTLFALR